MSDANAYHLSLRAHQEHPRLIERSQRGRNDANDPMGPLFVANTVATVVTDPL